MVCTLHTLTHTPQAALAHYRDEVVSGQFPNALYSPYRIPPNVGVGCVGGVCVLAASGWV